MDKLDTVVTGAGVIGLAIARALATAGREVLVIDRNPDFGQDTSSRNSEVIHAGIYYPKDSQKARHCADSAEMLYRYCDERGIPHRRTGKLIVGSADQRTTLQNYLQQGQKNGAQGLHLLEQSELREKEPLVKADIALWSPNTGIIDSHRFMQALIADISNHQGDICYSTELTACSKAGDGLQLEFADGYRLLCKQLIVCAGLYASDLALKLGVAPERIPETRYVRGRYYTYSANPGFRHLVYPVAGRDGLGIHLTLDMENNIRFGPDTQDIESIDYSFDDSALDSFVHSVRGYFPELDPSRLAPGYTGIRPKCYAKTNKPSDFIIHGPVETGIAGLFCLYGIESPGLTASLSIAQRIATSMHRAAD